MIRFGRMGLGMGAVLALGGATWAQLDLASLYTQTVKAGQPWAAIETKVNSLAITMEVNRGVVTTRATFEYTPGLGGVNEYVCAPVAGCDSLRGQVCPSTCQYRPVRQLVLDSLETTASFQESDNTVLTDMYLWVGDAKVKAALQVRALASAQYEDIVKRRRDPALIETWGNGRYSLRIFPGQSLQTRKIEIEFVQGFENAGEAVQTILPVLHRLAKVASDGVTASTLLPNRSIGSVSLMAVSLDGKSYALQWEGLGSGEVSGIPLRLSADNVEELKAGILSATSSACANCLTPWTAQKDGIAYFGVKTLLARKNLKFEAEPSERHFLVDVAASTDLNVVDRARKIALLSLKAYGQAPNRANLAFSNDGALSYAFPEAMPMDEGHLLTAYEALKAWSPPRRSNADATLRAFAKSRRAGSPLCLAYLVNNDSTPYFQWSGVYDAAMQARYQAWEKIQTTAEDDLLAALKAGNAMLFGFWNNYRLNRLATATGGFQVGSLYGYIYYAGGADGIATTTIASPERPVAPTLYLPPLFGPGRPDAYAISDLQVRSTGLAISNLVLLQEQAYWYNYLMAEAVMDARMGMMPYRMLQDTIILRISGQYQGSGLAGFAISGLWGGLRFTQDLTVDVPSGQGSGAAGAGIWAYQQTEAWGRDMLTDDILAMQQLGKEYHIVNRQMSLLALEPGVDLWTEMPSKQDAANGANTRVATEGGVTTDMAVPPGQSATATLDNASLEDILNGTVSLRDPRFAGARGAGKVTLRRTGKAMVLDWALGETAAQASFRILDLSGRLVAELPGVRTATGFSAEWQAAGRRGLYLVQARAGQRSLSQKLLVRP